MKRNNVNQHNYDSNAAKFHLAQLNPRNFLPYRDLPDTIARHLLDKVSKDHYKILDYGCGTGNSTQMVTNIFTELGIDVEIYGVDINESNLRLAKKNIPTASFISISQDDQEIPLSGFDLVICNFVLLENTFDDMVMILHRIQQVMLVTATLINTNSASHIYDQTKKWHSINNHFIENQLPLVDGQMVKLELIDDSAGDSFTFTDFFHSEIAYQQAYKEANLCLIETLEPLGKASEPIEWLAEKEYSPFKIHVLSKID